MLLVSGRSPFLREDAANGGERFLDCPEEAANGGFLVIGVGLVGGGGAAAWGRG